MLYAIDHPSVTLAEDDHRLFERDDRIGGLLRYGIPEFKMEKRYLDRRLQLMVEEGVQFQTNANIGVNVPVGELKAQFDAIVLAGGSTQPRDLQVPGRSLKGIHFAMEYLTLQNRRNEGDMVDDEAFISAKDKHVIIIGGGGHERPHSTVNIHTKDRRGERGLGL